MEETTITILDGECWVSTDRKKTINKVMGLMQESGEGRIIAMPETNDGMLYAKIPAEWIHIGKKRTVQLTEEQKAERAERLRRTRE